MKTITLSDAQALYVLGVLQVQEDCLNEFISDDSMLSCREEYISDLELLVPVIAALGE